MSRSVWVPRADAPPVGLPFWEVCSAIGHPPQAVMSWIVLGGIESPDVAGGRYVFTARWLCRVLSAGIRLPGTYAPVVTSYRTRAAQIAEAERRGTPYRGGRRTAEQLAADQAGEQKGGAS